MIGYKLFATHNTADYVLNTTTSVATESVVTELGNAEILKRIAERQISLVINVTERNKMRDPLAEKTTFGYVCFANENLSKYLTGTFAKQNENLSNNCLVKGID